MFKGEATAKLPAGLSEAQVTAKIEEILGELGRVKVDKRGGITIEPKSNFGNALTEVTIEGQLRKRGDGQEVSLSYNCKPTVVTYILAAVLFLTTCFGVAIILVPMLAKDPVAKAVRNALAELEDAFEAGKAKV